MGRISTHSAREDGDLRDILGIMRPIKFQPTPPARTETNWKPEDHRTDKISTHSAREDGDRAEQALVDYKNISTHSAREDGDLYGYAR